MRWTLLAALLGTSAIAVPNRYHIQADIFVNGNFVSRQEFVTSDGEEARKTLRGLTMRVQASSLTIEKKEDPILVKMTVDYKSGTEEITSSPEILADPGSEITVNPATNSNYPNGKMRIQLLATRE